MRPGQGAAHAAGFLVNDFIRKLLVLYQFYVLSSSNKKLNHEDYVGLSLPFFSRDWSSSHFNVIVNICAVIRGLDIEVLRCCH